MKPLPNTVVHLPTQEDYDELIKIKFKRKSEFWSWKGEDMCIYLDDDEFSWDKLKDAKAHDYKIITLKQLKDMNKTLENLEVGDLVKNDGGYFMKVLGVITPNNSELTLYITSWSNMDKNNDDLKKSSSSMTAYQLSKKGYTLYTETSDEIEKAMEVLERSGRIVDGKIIKN